MPQYDALRRLDALIDANGNRTGWERDLQGRVTREVRADGVTDTTYTYGARTGRLLTVTDPKEQVTTHTYAADDQILSTAFSNATIATPSVSYTYDLSTGVYRRWWMVPGRRPTPIMRPGNSGPARPRASTAP